MRRWRFLLMDGLGAALWVAGWGGLGYAFSGQLDRAADHASRLGGSLTVVLLAALGGWLAWKYVDRRRFLRRLAIARIMPAELERRLSEGEAVVVVDLRHRLEFEADPDGVPGALRLSPEEIEERHGEIPRDRDIVLYCT